MSLYKKVLSLKYRLKLGWGHFALIFVVLINAVGWIGFSVAPRPFPPLNQTQPKLDTVPIPAGLPTPVERYYRLTYGDKVPQVTTAVVTGRGSMRLFGMWIPARFRFTHEAGKNFRHDIDLTFMGIPLVHAKETYIDGKGYAKTPGGIEEGPDFEQGSNVSMWAEAFNWFPALLVTDPRVTWESVDNNTSLLKVPFGESSEVFVVRFDPTTGKPLYFEAMKYKSATKKQELWIGGVWHEDGKPWIKLDVEELVLNSIVSDVLKN